MGVIVAEISVLVKISVLARDSCVDDCAYILETVPMNQDHLFEASCGEDADLLHLLEELKLKELNLNEGEKKEVHKIIKKHKKAFSLLKTNLGRTELIKHSIDTGNGMPVRQQPRRMLTKQKQEVGKLVDDMLDDAVISTSKWPWSSPIVLVKKKDGSVRFCVDYRTRNNCTKKCIYPLPRIDNSLDQPSGCGYFSTLDLKSGYWQISMHEKDKEKRAFTCHKRLFEFNVMPFGLANAPATFQHLMKVVLNGIKWDGVLAYVDDIIVYARILMNTYVISI